MAVKHSVTYVLILELYLNYKGHKCDMICQTMISAIFAYGTLNLMYIRINEYKAKYSGLKI